MKIDGLLKLFIEQLENEVGGFEYDEELDLIDDRLRLENVDNPGLVVEIDVTLKSMSIYLEFGYYAYPNDLRESPEIDRIEEESRIYYSQVDFEKSMSNFDYPIDTWEEERYGCLCQTVCIGIRDVPCEMDLIKRFVERANGFCCSDFSFEDDFRDIRDKRLNIITSQGKRNPRVSIAENNNIDYHILNKNDVLIYSGLEYVLINKKDSSVAISKCDWDYVYKIIGYVELFQDCSIEIDDKVTIHSCSYSFGIPIVSFTQATEMESLLFDSNLKKLMMFLEKGNKDLLSKTFMEYGGQNRLNESLFFPHIYTEGQTDCLHIKNAFLLSKEYNKETWVFDENQRDSEKGDQELLNECRAFSKEADAPCARIMVFDRDGSIQLSEIEDEKTGYKNWGNRVYSFALPIPKHRKDTPKISIEHYYSNSELLQEFDIGGEKRRLYMGCEFDSIGGRAPLINRICRDRKKCGEKSIAIIDKGVFDISTLSQVDYALSKMKFAELICKSNIYSADTENAFALLFNRIRKILLDNKEI